MTEPVRRYLVFTPGSASTGEPPERAWDWHARHGAHETEARARVQRDRLHANGVKATIVLVEVDPLASRWCREIEVIDAD